MIQFQIQQIQCYFDINAQLIKNISIFTTFLGLNIIFGKFSRSGIYSTIRKRFVCNCVRPFFYIALLFKLLQLFNLITTTIIYESSSLTFRKLVSPIHYTLRGKNKTKYLSGQVIHYYICIRKVFKSNSRNTLYFEMFYVINVCIGSWIV